MRSICCLCRGVLAAPLLRGAVKVVARRAIASPAQASAAAVAGIREVTAGPSPVQKVEEDVLSLLSADPKKALSVIDVRFSFDPCFDRTYRRFSYTI